MKALLSFFDFIPGWLWAAICSVFLSTACTQSLRLDREKASHATYRADIERQMRGASEKARQTEKELQDAADQAQREAKAIRERLDAADSRAAAAAQRLRNAISTNSACEAARTADERRAADEAANLRADMLGRLDEAAGVIGRFADEANQAGLTCQRLYGKARSPAD